MDTSQKSKADKIVQDLQVEVSKAIALRALLKKFAHDKRIADAFDDTYEANAFNLIEDALVGALTMSLIRACDESERGDVNSFRVLFEVVAPPNDTENYFGNGSTQFEKARGLYIILKGSHQVARVKALRHKFIAHSAIEKAKVQKPKYDDLYDLLSSCVNIVELLAPSVCCQNTDYEGEKEVWKKYSKLFFNSLIQGQVRKSDT